MDVRARFPHLCVSGIPLAWRLRPNILKAGGVHGHEAAPLPRPYAQDPPPAAGGALVAAQAQARPSRPRLAAAFAGPTDTRVPLHRPSQLIAFTLARVRRRGGR